MSELLLESVLVCPVCGSAKRETMPTDACQFLRMYELPDAASPETRRLLRLLFLWLGEVSFDAGRELHLCIINFLVVTQHDQKPLQSLPRVRPDFYQPLSVAPSGPGTCLFGERL
jgi:hypothetical protein